jgi:hypothetical protein
MAKVYRIINPRFSNLMENPVRCKTRWAEVGAVLWLCRGEEAREQSQDGIYEVSAVNPSSLI